nr:hypothetical protein [Oenococcus oeni]
MTRWIESTPSEYLKIKSPEQVETSKSSDLQLTGKELQKLRGFGGCFNELGYLPLKQLDKKKQEEIYRDLFSPDELNLSFNRTPIGANDFAETWYSYDETDGDYDLKNFSIDHDKETLIPYIKNAQKYQPDLELFVSPWKSANMDEIPQSIQFRSNSYDSGEFAGI